jgi:ABC-type transport system involved in multi-copper enzyme maturation permease subunit
MSLFGPVLPYDLVRTTRRGRYALFRCVYLAILLLTIYLLYEGFARRTRYDLTSRGVSPHQLAEFGESFFVTFMVVQLVTVYLITPIYTANAIAEEKERRTLEFLLATDLSSREIVFSKLLSRVAQMAMLLLAGLPVLSLLQFLGGVDPDLLLFGFLCTVLTMVSVASFGLLLSLNSRNTLEAAFGTYFFVALHLLLTVLCIGPSEPALNFGNPFTVLASLNRTAFIGTRSQGEVLTEALLGYAAFHLGVTVLCTVWLIQKLRAAALAPPAVTAVEEAVPAPTELLLGLTRPPMGDDSLWWKEAHDETHGRKGRSDVLRLLGMAIALPGIGVLLFGLLLSRNPAMSEGLLKFTRLGMCVLGNLMLLTVALSAASRFSREIEHQTLDTLLTIPERGKILTTKWIASIAYPRSFGYLLVVMLLINTFCGNRDLLALLLIAAAWFVYAAFLASLGVWLSLWLSSTVRATLMTLLIAAVLMVAAALVLGVAESATASIDRFAAPYYQEYGTAPPVTLCALAFSMGERELLSGEVATFAFCGIVLYGLFAWFFWERARGQFWLLTGEARKETMRSGEPRTENRE